MKTTPRLHPLVIALGTTCLLALPSFSQSAEGFDTSGLAPAGAPEVPAAAPATPVQAGTAEPAKQATIAELGPSRYAGTGPELAAYVERFASTMSIRNRTTDPFGRYQDPEFKAPEPKIINSNKNKAIPRAAPPMPFSDVVAAIQVNVVIPGQKRFLISTATGARSMKQGDVFPIQLPSGKRVRVQVRSVTASAIQFLNVDTGETGVLKPGVMPEGMQKGTGGITAPGMQPDGPDAPLEIQAISPISSN